ncbi:hypothetical protein ACFQJC_17115 [Haloferax namakaokahaiae]|uniref:Uncharacterized protein n=1 Tax=Haloferax namakaokahaiae TaxID=1748331 RepID=A0ABD5ZIZ7_9EURY
MTDSRPHITPTQSWLISTHPENHKDDIRRFLSQALSFFDTEIVGDHSSDNSRDFWGTLRNWIDWFVYHAIDETSLKEIKEGELSPERSGPIHQYPGLMTLITVLTTSAVKTDTRYVEKTRGGYHPNMKILHQVKALWKCNIWAYFNQCDPELQVNLLQPFGRRLYDDRNWVELRHIEPFRVEREIHEGIQTVSFRFSDLGMRMSWGNFVRQVHSFLDESFNTLKEYVWKHYLSIDAKHKLRNLPWFTNKLDHYIRARDHDALYTDYHDIPPLIREIVTAIHQQSNSITNRGIPSEPSVEFGEWVTSDRVHELLIDHIIQRGYREELREVSNSSLKIAHRLGKHENVRSFEVNKSGRRNLFKFERPEKRDNYTTFIEHRNNS